MKKVSWRWMVWLHRFRRCRRCNRWRRWKWHVGKVEVRINNGWPYTAVSTGKCITKYRMCWAVKTWRHFHNQSSKSWTLCIYIYIYMCSSGDLKLALLEWCQSTDHPVDAMNYALKLHHYVPWQTAAGSDTWWNLELYCQLHGKKDDTFGASPPNSWSIYIWLVSVSWVVQH